MQGIYSFLSNLKKSGSSPTEQGPKHSPSLFVKILIAVFLIVLALTGIITLNNMVRKNTANSQTPKAITASVNRSFDFPAVITINNRVQPSRDKVKLKVANVEKTNQVIVQDQVFTARNSKKFLIVNLELRNDTKGPLNIVPGDLIRLAITGNEDTKFAPDLHNNTVSIAAISTKIDRVGFVIPEDAKSFKLYIGEIDGTKEEIAINLSS